MRPILFSFEILPGLCIVVNSYRFFGALGFSLFICLAVTNARREGFSPLRALAVAFLSCYFAFIGSMVFSLLLKHGFIALRPAMFIRSEKSLASYGAILTFPISVIALSHLLKLPGFKILDLWAPFAALGQSIGRLGCLFAGCCYGKVTHFPFGVFFPDFTSTGGTVRYPTQIYMSLSCLFIFVVLRLHYPRRGRPGQIVALYLAMQATFTLMIYPFRGSNPAITHPPDPGTVILLLGLLALFSGLGWLSAFILRQQPVPHQGATDTVAKAP